jgi:hypothetical protein
MLELARRDLPALSEAPISVIYDGQIVALRIVEAANASRGSTKRS